MMRNPHRTRNSQVSHFYFEGCRYYTPLDTEGTKIHLRQPEWLPNL